jgi:hypothetical protein
MENVRVSLLFIIPHKIKLTESVYAEETFNSNEPKLAWLHRKSFLLSARLSFGSECSVCLTAASAQ